MKKHVNYSFVYRDFAIRYTIIEKETYLGNKRNVWARVKGMKGVRHSREFMIPLQDDWKLNDELKKYIEKYITDWCDDGGSLLIKER